MLKLIVGSRGSGKTKTLIDLVNNAGEVTKGNVVCVEKGDQLGSALSNKIRLIDIDEYGIEGAEEYYGFLAGILAGDYDITELFCDATYRIICGPDCKEPAALEAFMTNIIALAEKSNANLAFTVSADADDIPEKLKKYIV